MPMDLIESNEESARQLPGKELQIWLDIPDPKAECLDVRGIRKIEIADFWGEGAMIGRRSAATSIGIL